MQAQPAGVLDALARCVRVEVHDVVRIDEAHRHAPRLSLIGQRPSRRAQPVDGAAGGQMVERVAAQSVPDQVSGREVVGEAVLLHLGRHEGADLARVGRLAEMPLALVGGVVAGLAQQMPERGMRERQVPHPRHVEILEHAIVGSLQSRHHHGARRGAHRRRTLVVRERYSAILQALMPGQGQAPGPLRVIAFLVGEDEQDVRSRIPVAGGNNRRRRRCLRPSRADERGREERGERGAGCRREEGPPCRVWPGCFTLCHDNTRVGNSPRRNCMIHPKLNDKCN